MKQRMPQVNELIKQEVSKLLQEEIADEIFAVTDVEVSKDLSHAKVWVSSENIEKLVLRCQGLTAKLQRELAHKINLRRMPKLHFVADKGRESVERIETLLKKIKEEDDSVC